MKTLLMLAGAALIAGSLSATAAEKPDSKPADTGTTAPTHSMDSMMAGSHAMAGDKHHHMSDRMMPSHSRHCTEEALAKMPAEHRAACGK